MPYLDTPEARLFFEDHAPTRDRPLVLLHGWACDSSDWDPLLAGLTARHRVVTVDLRGNGRSGTSTDGYSPGALADDVVRILDFLGMDAAVVAGHSAGAEVAVTMSVRHPERVSAVISVDPAYGFAPEDRDVVRQVSRQLNDSDSTKVAADYFARLDDNPATPPEIAARHQESALRCRPEVARRMFDAFAFGPDSFHFRPGTDEFLLRRRAPLLAFYRNDARAAVGEKFVSRPADRVVTYPGAGHWPHQEQPDRFVADVELWLETLHHTGETS